MAIASRLIEIAEMKSLSEYDIVKLFVDKPLKLDKSFA
jgi:hypothetical protein